MSDLPRGAKRPKVTVRKIVSGGQTGVDRGALDAAIALGIAHGGWCPKSRMAEDGVIPDRYQLVENNSTDYAVRTEQNLLDSDATLILHSGPLSGGTTLTRNLAEQHQRPCLLVDLEESTEPTEARAWLAANRPQVLNIAGPRESHRRGIGQQTVAFVTALLSP